MFHKLSGCKRGFMLAYALILMVIFSALGVSIVSMLSTSSITSSENLLSLQCLFVAESGAEIRIREALEGDISNGSRIYTFNDAKNYKAEVNFKKIADTPDGKEIFSIYSTGSIFNVKRRIFLKFWR